MPSISLRDSVSPKVLKEKKMASMAKSEEIVSDYVDSLSDKKNSKRSKKKRNLANTGSDSDEVIETAKKDKKLKYTDVEKEEVISDFSNGVNASTNKQKKAKPVSAADGGESVEENPNAISKFRISKPLREKLKSNGIEALFPIQAMTFDTIFDGIDLVGRARTGQGKTLAFVLPILESLANGPLKSSRATGYGKAPSVLVLLPTRELANQVYADFNVYGCTLGLTSCSLYGGTPYNTQQLQLKRGVDIVVGTPGRIKDHIERGTIDLSLLKFRVLDEADEMLRMGFVEDVELILGNVKDAKKVQTLLFSATLPKWVADISLRFLKTNKKTVDLVNSEKMKASTNVRHIVLPCYSSARNKIIPDVIRCYSSGGRTIVFTETKDSASELSEVLSGARPLHGDIQQSHREVTLSGFRQGKFMTLVATNVAARGLDINDVQLIIQCEPPRDVEAYIHRSGRTGRAGNTGVAVMLYDPRKANVSKIEKESGVKFERITAPQPADIAKSAGTEAADLISQVSDTVVPAFKTAAEDLLSSSGLSAVDLLAKAIAKAAGYTDIKTRSLLSSAENYVTCHLVTERPIYTPSVVFALLRRYLPDDKVEEIQDLTLTACGNGAIFDVPSTDVDLFLRGSGKVVGLELEVIKELPELREREQSRGGGRGGGVRFSGGGGGGRGARGGGGFGGRNSRFSGGRGRW